MSSRYTKKPEGSNWGDFGEDDEIGRLNLIDKDKVLQGIAEVKQGKTFCLSLPLDYPGKNIISPVRFPPSLKAVIRNDEEYYNYEWEKQNPRYTDIAADDLVTLYTQYSTQWDSFAHRGSKVDLGTGEKEPVYYNGYKANKDVIKNSDGSVFAHKLGIDKFAEHGIQGRGILVNLYKYFGTTPQKLVGYEDLMRILKQDNIVVEKGDVLCLWTGLDELILSYNKNPIPELKNSCAVLDGRDAKLLDWIDTSGISAIASDNIAVEALGGEVPCCSSTILPLHELCLFKLGIPLGELWYLADLAKWLEANNRSRFLLTAPPLRLPGAVGSPVTPIATV